MDHFIGHVIGEMALEFRVALEKGEVALVGTAVQIVDLGDKTVPVLPEDTDGLHGKRSLTEFSVESAFNKPPVHQSQHRLS